MKDRISFKYNKAKFAEMKGTIEQRFYHFALRAADKISPVYSLESLVCGWKVSCCNINTIARVNPKTKHIEVSTMFVRLCETTKVFILLNLFFQVKNNGKCIDADKKAVDIMKKNKFKFEFSYFLNESNIVLYNSKLPNRISAIRSYLKSKKKA